MMISDYLTDKLDVLTTKLQRRGYRLTNMQVAVVGCTFVTTTFGSMSRDSYFFAALNGLLWGANLWERIVWAHRNQIYFESIKHVERLNSESLHWREMTRWFSSLVFFIGVFFIGMVTTSLFIEPKTWLVATIFEWISLIMAFMIRGCFFIGPGEFAKQERESELHNAVLDKLP